VTEQKAKKDEYQKALVAYGQAMKEFHKGEFAKAAESLESFLEKFPNERELVDRAKLYLSICKAREKKETVHLKTFEDHYNQSVFRINKGEYEGALKLLEKALEMKTDEGKVFYLMADAYCKMGQVDTCLDYLKKAIQKDKYFRTLAQNESDFEPIWEDKKFKLITRMS
jgi:tetratricopeptide (TPR) repeat protein